MDYHQGNIPRNSNHSRGKNSSTVPSGEEIWTLPSLQQTDHVGLHLPSHWTLWQSLYSPGLPGRVLVAIQNIHQLISSCSICAQAKVPCILLASKLIPLPTPQKPWSHSHQLSQISPYIRTTVIVVITDCFLKSLHLIPLPQVFDPVLYSSFRFMPCIVYVVCISSA